jgi:two-component system phosphate regulon sensor histidine kinase PhoR
MAWVARWLPPARRAPADAPARDRELESLARVSAEFARTHDPEVVARTFLDEIGSLFRIEFAALTLVSEDLREASGFLARSGRSDVDWWRDVRLDLERDPSGIASAVYEGAAFAVYDVEGSSRVSMRLAQSVQAKSAAFVPLVSGDDVIAVLSVATTSERRTFTAGDLDLMQTLATETAMALDRARSSIALQEALDRERLLRTITRKLRSALDLDAVLDIAVSETGRALRADRCFIRLGEPGASPMPLAAEWNDEGVEPVGELAEQLPASNLALRERRTIAVSDVLEEPALAEPALGRREALAELRTRSVLSTPVIAMDEVIGVVSLHRGAPGAWTQADIAVSEAVAHEAGLAIHLARALERSRERLGQQSALLRAAEVLTGQLELEGVLERLADQVAELLDADAADCYLLDHERGILTCAAVNGLPAELLGFEFPADKGIAGLAIRRGEPVGVTDYAELEDPVPSPAYEGFTHVIVAPMRWSDEVQGVLGVGRRAGGRPFTQAEADVLEAFGGLASLALRNAESFSRSSRQARVQRGFYRIASVLGQSLSLAATQDAVAQAASEALGGGPAAVLMPRGGRLVLAGSFELPDAVSAFLADVAGTGAPLDRAAAQRRVLASPNVDDDDRFSDEWRALAKSVGASALLAMPVDTPRHEVGGLVIVFFRDARAFTDEDLELARHLADATRGALERSELFEAERTSRALAQQLARTGSLLATELDPAAVLDEVVQQAPALVSADACAIRVLEDDELIVSAAEGHGADDALETRSPASGWLSGDVVQSRGPVAIEDASQDPRLVERDPMLAAGHAAFLGVPLVGPEGALHGVLAVYSRTPRSWREEEVEAMLALAANTSAALSNAELYQRVALEKERSFAILANIADGIVAVDREGEVVLWNSAAEQITGVPATEALGRTPADVLQRTLESPGTTPPRDRFVSITRGDEEVWLSLTEAVMRDPAGAVAGRIFAFRDISADRQLEQMKSDFVSTVSHELRTPLTSIYGFAETLLRQDVLFGEDERRTFLGYVASESQRLTAIVDALLNVARLDAGDLSVNLGPTNVTDLAEQVVASARASGNANGHRFVLDLPPEPLRAEADPDKLRQVFSILLDNALKYSPDGGTVTVGATRRDQSVEVRVVDQGIGIPEAEQERIFRKFYRGGEAARTGAAGGTGLGLFIARGLVAAMGGRIRVESREGEGSSFAVELPLARAAATDAEGGRV